MLKSIFGRRSGNREKGTVTQSVASYPGSRFEKIQFASSDEILALQCRLLKKHLEYSRDNSPFYKALFRDWSIDIEDIKTPDDLAKIPITEKHNLASQNYNFIAVPERDVVDVCFTSGSMGTGPTQLFLTHSDIARLAYNEELAFRMAGVKKTDTLMVCAAIDRCFMAGLAYFLGGLRIGAKVVRAGAGSPAQQWNMLKETGATVLVGVPSLLVKIAKYALDCGKEPGNTFVKKIIAIGEPVRDRHLRPLPVTQKLEELWDAEVYSTYASSEMATTFAECRYACGGHLRPELIIVEIIDEDELPLSDGEVGELVVTPLGQQAMPLVRFRTGDISFIINGECSCGRKTRRLGPVLGRKKQMMKVMGTTVFPNTILSILEGDDNFHGGIVEAKTDNEFMQQVTLYAAVNDEKVLSSERIQEILQASLRFKPAVEMISKEEYEKRAYPTSSKRKKVSFVDLRRGIF